MAKAHHVGDYWAEVTDLYAPLTDDQIADIRVRFGVTEEVRNVPDCPGYAVSSCGRAFSCVPCAWKRDQLVREMTLSTMVHGHRYIRMQKAKKPVVGLVHRLIAMTFLPPPADHQTIVRHLDGDPNNNSVSNLAWGTQADNMADCVRHGRTNAGERNPSAKLTSDDVRHIRTLHESGYKVKTISIMYGVGEETIRCVVLRRSWKHV